MFNDQRNAKAMYYFTLILANRKKDATLLQRFLCLIFLISISSTGKLLAQDAAIGKSLEDRIHSSDFDTRFDAVLGLSLNQDSVRILSEVLNNDSSPEIKALAATRLGQTHLPEAISPLLTMLQNLARSKKKDKDIFLQRTIDYALGNFPDTAVVNTLISETADKDPMIRSAAVESLGKIQDRAAITALIQLLRDKESFVRARTAAALGSFKDSQSVTPLISVLAHDEAGEVRREAARSLGLIGGTEAHRALEAALSDKDMFVRRYSWEALHPDQPM